MTNNVLKPHLGRFCNVYVDDIIVYSRSEKDHSEHLATVLQALSDVDLKINEKKSEFLKPRVVLLGRVFDGANKTTKQESVQRIAKLAKPHDLHSLGIFLALAGHFRAFIKYSAKTPKCLMELTKNGVPFVWTEECEVAYQELVHRLSSDTVLTLPDFSLPFEMNTYAFSYGTGEVSHQIDTHSSLSQHLRVIGYCSYTFSPRQVYYTTTEKEALAVLMAVGY